MSALGPDSEVELADADFCFTLQSRHVAGGPGCRLRANTDMLPSFAGARFCMSLKLFHIKAIIAR